MKTSSAAFSCGAEARQSVNAQCWVRPVLIGRLRRGFRALASSDLAVVVNICF